MLGSKVGDLVIGPLVGEMVGRAWIEIVGDVVCFAVGEIK